MSFDFNPIGNLSNVQASSKSCPGGGGNTGYFKRGEKDENENTPKFKESENDCFEKVELEDITEEQKEETLFGLLKRIYIRFLVKLIRIFKPKK